MNIADALSGRAGIAGVRWALLGRESRDVVAERLHSLLSDGAEVTSWHLYRAKFKPDRRLNAHFHVTIRRGGDEQRRAVVVNWIPIGSDGHAGDGAGTRALEADAIERGLAAPFTSLHAADPDRGMEMLVSPLDPGFPQLVELSDPEAVRALLADALDQEGERSAAYEVSTIRYRPAERHVLRYQPAGGDTAGRETIFAKMSRGHDVGREFRVATAASDWVEAMNLGAHAARPLTFLEEKDALLYHEVPGEPLSTLLLRQDPAAEEQVRRTGAILRALHDSSPTSDLQLEQHDFHRELKAIARAAEHVDRLLPEAARVIHDVLRRAEPTYTRLRGEPPTFVHGDFKADHLLVAGSELTALDFGTCGAGDPALDLGKLSADLHWWYSIAGGPDLGRARAAFYEGYGDAPEDRLLRARVYESLILMKSTVRRVPLFEDDWEDRTSTLIRLADELLASVERSGAPAT
jgi:aminoglycoside phosphotransferase (APT) family kinase protein